jgi:hypothetical protein
MENAFKSQGVACMLKLLAFAHQSFVLDNATTMVQRVYRGHLGRRKYKLRYDVIWAQKAEKWALVLQAGYRGMKGESLCSFQKCSEAQSPSRVAEFWVRRTYCGAFLLPESTRGDATRCFKASAASLSRISGSTHDRRRKHMHRTESSCSYTRMDALTREF